MDSDSNGIVNQTEFTKSAESLEQVCNMPATQLEEEFFKLADDEENDGNITLVQQQNAIPKL
jgi:hypothetical protein